MASRRFIVLICITALFLIRCGGSENVSEPSDNSELESSEAQSLADGTQNLSGASDNAELIDISEAEASLPMLSDTYQYRSSLFSNPFDIRPAEKDTVPKGNRGFRIQIASTDYLSLADTAAAKLQNWIQEQAFPYEIYTYVEFRSPNYRVHLGDFYKREDALALAKQMRGAFRQAWVVYDKIRPERSPFYQKYPDLLEALPGFSMQADTLMAESDSLSEQ